MQYICNICNHIAQIFKLDFQFKVKQRLRQNVSPERGLTISRAPIKSNFIQNRAVGKNKYYIPNPFKVEDICRAGIKSFYNF